MTTLDIDILIDPFTSGPPIGSHMRINAFIDGFGLINERTAAVIGNGSGRAFNDATTNDEVTSDDYQFIQELWITPEGNISNTDTGDLTRVQKWLKKDGSEVAYKIVV